MRPVALKAGERVYNVRVAIVDLVVASSEAEAIDLLRHAIDSAKLTALDDDAHNDAFESETLANGTDVLTKAGRASLVVKCETCSGTGRITSSCDPFGIAPCPTCRLAAEAVTP